MLYVFSASLFFSLKLECCDWKT